MTHTRALHKGNTIIDPAEWANAEWIPLRYAADTYGRAGFLENSFRKYCDNGAILSKRVGKFRLIHRPSLLAYMAERGMVADGYTYPERAEKIIMAADQRPCVGCTLLVDVPEKYCRFCIADGKV